MTPHASAPGGTPSRVVLRVKDDDLTGSRGEDRLGATLAEARETAEEVTLIVSGPVLPEGLADAVALARNAGFVRVGLRTVAAGLGRRESVDSLVAAGLSDACMWLWGAEPRVHEHHTDRSGSFAETVSTLSALRSAGVSTAAATPLTRSNHRLLFELPPLLASRGVSAWCVVVPRAVDPSSPVPGRVMPRLALALPFALHALSMAHAAGVPAWVAGAPLCLLGPFAQHALPTTMRSYGTPCASCASRPTCPGVDGGYLRRFGGDELRPRPAAGRPWGSASLGRLFVDIDGTAGAPWEPAS